MRTFFAFFSSFKADSACSTLALSPSNADSALSALLSASCHRLSHRLSFASGVASPVAGIATFWLSRACRAVISAWSTLALSSPRSFSAFLVASRRAWHATNT
jgi:hypothetical protein